MILRRPFKRKSQQFRSFVLLGPIRSDARRWRRRGLAASVLPNLDAPGGPRKGRHETLFPCVSGVTGQEACNPVSTMVTKPVACVVHGRQFVRRRGASDPEYAIGLRPPHVFPFSRIPNQRISNFRWQERPLKRDEEFGRARFEGIGEI